MRHTHPFSRFSVISPPAALPSHHSHAPPATNLSRSLSLPPSAARTSPCQPLPRAGEEQLRQRCEEDRRLVDDGHAPQRLLEGVAGDREHGEAAVLDLGRLHHPPVVHEPVQPVLVVHGGARLDQWRHQPAPKVIQRERVKAEVARRVGQLNWLAGPERAPRRREAVHLVESSALEVAGEEDGEDQEGRRLGQVPVEERRRATLRRV
mmetsp:Transcript_5703/g.16571  ORF Transcript_5703/g.16571 Transcript_5703/m.16571 type:complete len:207 (+) Transcript_5703:138-758(+)